VRFISDLTSPLSGVDFHAEPPNDFE
jgi:hypothetical protein